MLLGASWLVTVQGSRENAASTVSLSGVDDEEGIAAVEFGPVGAGHHGPEEWVSLASLTRYRQALNDFVRALPAALRDTGQEPPLRALP